MNVKPIGNRVSPAPKKLSAKDRLIASAHRRLKNREKKLARLRSDFEMDAGVFTRQDRGTARAAHSTRREAVTDPNRPDDLAESVLRGAREFVGNLVAFLVIGFMLFVAIGAVLDGCAALVCRG